MSEIKIISQPNHTFNQDHIVYSVNGIAPTITAGCGMGGGNLPEIIVFNSLERVAEIYGDNNFRKMDNTIDHTFDNANRIYSTLGLAPTITTFCGGVWRAKS